MKDHPPAPVLRIYVVENDTDSRLMLSMLLKGWGHEVDSASSMGEALQHLPGHRYDVLISDIGLPDGSGWQMMELLRELDVKSTGFAIAMSGYGMGSDRERSLSAGFRHHLIKPMDIDQLEGLLLEAASEIQDDKSPPVRPD